jgi:NADH-quinone oxidoreductase subunit A
MVSAYIPIALFVVVATGFAAFTLVFTSLIHPSKYNKVKLEPYECGIEPVTGARDRYSIRYYLVAMLFVIFDLEAVFIFAWAIVVREAGWAGYSEALAFITVLIATLFYLWRVGALDWRQGSGDGWLIRNGR